MPIRPIPRKFYAGTVPSEEFDPATGTCTIEYFYGRKDPFRVAPGTDLVALHPLRIIRNLAHPNPLQTSEDYKRQQEKEYLEKEGYHSSIVKDIVEELQNDSKEILSKHKIEISDWEVVSLGERGFLSTQHDTLVLCTLDEEPARWNSCVTQIHNFLRTAVRKGMEIKVELRNETRMYEAWTGAIRNGPATDVLRSIQDPVTEKIRSLFPAWRAISFYMLGRGERWPEYDLSRWKPTLFVGVPPETRVQWEKIQEEIVEYIVELSKDFELEFELGVEFRPAVLYPS